MEEIMTAWELVKQLMIAVPSVIAITLTLTSTFNGTFKITNPKAKKWVSWILAAVAGVGFAITGGLTMFAQPVANLIAGAVCGLFAGAAANGVYEWEKVENFFKLIEGIFNPQVKKVAQKED